ncbi:MAG TPA: hypothetical protein VK559_00970, partial [Ferruginibacter sp.]|nr:hypothetical protein [Ferruginibacter sp.]
RIAYTWQQALNSDPASEEYKDQIPYTPNNSGSAIVAAGYKGWRAGYNLLFSDYRYVLGANSPANRLPGWITQGAFVNKTVAIHQVQANIKLAVENIFDTKYYVVNYYPMPGRSYNISIIFNNL